MFSRLGSADVVAAERAPGARTCGVRGEPGGGEMPRSKQKRFQNKIQQPRENTACPCQDYHLCQLKNKQQKNYWHGNKESSVVFPEKGVGSILGKSSLHNVLAVSRKIKFALTHLSPRSDYLGL